LGSVPRGYISIVHSPQGYGLFFEMQQLQASFSRMCLRLHKWLPYAYFLENLCSAGNAFPQIFFSTPQFV